VRIEAAQYDRATGRIVFDSRGTLKNAAIAIHRFRNYKKAVADVVRM